MRKEVGVVVSTQDSPSVSEVNFVITQNTVKRGSYVEIDYDEGTMICLVTQLIKTNRYFERADSVKEIETNNEIARNFPIAEWEFLVAKAKPLGCLAELGKKKIVKRVSLPPAPGSKVFAAEKKNLFNFLGLDENGLNLGNVEFHDIEMKVNMDSLLRKHLAIVAMSGAGKSYLVSVLIEELLERKKELGRLAIVVIDPHGEYTGFAEPTEEYANYSHQTNLVRGQDIRISLANNFGLLQKLLGKISTTQKRILSEAFNSLKEEMKKGNGPFSLEELKERILSEAKNEKTRNIASALEELIKLKIFAKTDNPSLLDIVKPAQLTIIDLSDIIDMKKKTVIVDYVASRLFHERRRKHIPPFLLVVEEAHQFAPEKVSKEEAISKGIIRTIAREGRKFGACLALVSQRPVYLDTTALAQCNTKIILRLTNPYDVDHVSKSSEAIDADAKNMITSLRVGEALIVGEAVNAPVFFNVRQRKSMPSKHEISLEEQARMFEEFMEEANREAEAYL
ncbi:MAG: DUF87 domain-containing protein [Candidatus Diapherotrites archaeon]|nr:DUF87 domain-containing protein [Candidatus Diapherotrites archaeon]